MFNKELFANLLQKAIDNDTIKSFADKALVDRSYLSKYINKRLDSPPSPEILKRIANASDSKIAYNQLMEASGYIKSESELILTNLQLVMNNMSAKGFVEFINNPGITEDLIEAYLDGEIIPQIGSLSIIADALDIDYKFFYEPNSFKSLEEARNRYKIAHSNQLDEDTDFDKLIKKIKEHDLDVNLVNNMLDLMIAQIEKNKK